jgi:Kelch motif/Galactose oxidase, central domain
MRSQLRTHTWLSWIGFTLSLGVSLLTACGNPSTPAQPTGSSSSSSSSVSVAITPSTATATEGGYVAYTASVKGTANTAVTWSIQEGATGGSIASSGVYTAPNTPGTYHVVATSVADPTKSASAVVTIQQPPVITPSVSVTISPATATVTEGGFLSFVATVKGTANTAVTWSVKEGPTGGSISTSGLYTAPNAVGTYHVVGASIADATASASAVVTTYVTPPVLAGTFTAVGNMTAARIWNTATLLGSGKVLIAGGWDGHQTLASAELYDPATRTFSPTGSMITPRAGLSATLLADGRVLITGGIAVDGLYPTDSIPLNTVEIYDPSTGMFTAAGDLNSFDEAEYVLLPDGRFLVMVAHNAEIYDPHSDTFTPTGPYADPGLLYPGTFALLADGKVLVQLCDSICSVVVTEVFDPQNGTFSRAGPFVDPSLTYAYLTAVALPTNGKVLVTGCDSLSNVGEAELFDPQSGTFSRTGPMTSSYFPDYGYTAMLLADGRVLFVGGDARGTDVEIYDPATGTFASVGNAIQYQGYAPLTRLTDGTVLIAGGQLPGGNGNANAELFVPSSNTIEYAGQMTVGRDSLTAIALPDDTVLITGGYTYRTYPNLQPVYVQPLSSAEIYKPR